MISLPSSFPRRVRIHGGGFDASARAMHRNAAIENVSVATIERTTMSTKTTIKRVALVAVAAMGFGLLSVVPSSAGVSQADTLTLASAATTGTLGGTAVAVVNQSFVAGAAADSLTATASLVSAPVGSAFPLVLTTGGGTVVNTTGTSISGLTSGVASSAAGYTTGFTTATFTPTVAGTYVVKFTPAAGAGNTGTIQAAAVTWTFTVAAEGAATAADSTWGMIAGIATPVQGTKTAITVAKTLPAAQVATIRVAPLKAGGVALNTAIKLSATITGPGTLGVGTSNSTTTSSTGRAITSAAIGDYTFGVFNDGTAGVATITITEPGGAVLATATVNFSDSLASYTLTPTNTVTAVGATDSVAIVGKDAAGVTAVLGTYYASSSNTAVATVVTTGQTGSTFLVTGVAAGTAVITVANASSSPTITKTYTVTVGKATIKTVTITTDKTSYAAGEKVTVTVTAKGSDGTAVGDSTLNAFSAAVTSNLAVQGTLPTASIAFVGGVKTFVIYAPSAAGTVTLTGTEGSSTDNVIAGGTAATITASFDVSNPASDAATDAANAATDAANYAADAADAATTAAQEATAAAVAAQESADAATAAVVALGLRVDTLLASVRAQLTSIANLIKRILKKK
ncbi:MAG: hypothetical protein Q8L08_05595 [Candidatus Nanopelagicaceae bacterium]|nr:hypothetical protein [Candidatus Nanopelagicaceae bacterium]